jgi:hypothetical protein
MHSQHSYANYSSGDWSIYLWNLGKSVSVFFLKSWIIGAQLRHLLYFIVNYWIYIYKLINILFDERDYSRVSTPARCGCKRDIRSSPWSGHNCPGYICKLFNIPVFEMCSVFVHVKLFNSDVKPGIYGQAKVSLTAGRNVLLAVPAASWSQLKSATYSVWLLEATASFWAVSRPAHH